MAQPNRGDDSSHYTVLARRYRPQQFADLVGQEPVARALMRAIETGRVAHAYLFTGARGVGKTSAARILAKALNCENGPTPHPCDRCPICQSIASGEDIDVLEFDAASNRGIDEVREIRQNVQYRPNRARYKIYIIDEVHMLTVPAFNALLKTLEEPPPHVKFIFATTEVQKIPITILSRCQRFDFAGISTPRIVERLQQIVSAEGMEADPEALELVARRAGGSMRDAQSLLDQLLAFAGGRLTGEQVHRLLGTAHVERVVALASAMVDQDAKTALHLLGQAADEGLQLGELLDQLIDYWRDLMVVAAAGDDAPPLTCPPRFRDTLRHHARRLPIDSILAGLDILGATKARMRGSSHGRVLAEMAVVRLSRLEHLVSLAELARGLAEGSEVSPAPSRSRPSAPPLGLLAAAPADAGASAEQKKKPEPVRAVPPAPPVPLELTAERVSQLWPVVLDEIGPASATDLKKAGLPAISGPNALVLRFPPEYNAAREHCQRPQVVSRIEEVLRKITGQACAVRIESASAEGPDDVSAAPPLDAERSQFRSRRWRDEAERDPLVRRALDLLGAQIVRVDDGFGTVPKALPERAEETETLQE
ncbi:MAG: DNA polymerase III subunit gamma/tau [Gemmataceae bacterium]|nr:DNA polymerase III subunit gamma/tau [Gemmataceae bacterium]MDW8266542.1 DNA polymerase III subunit gamma/tau [Gemmataceae bacterium]